MKKIIFKIKRLLGSKQKSVTEIVELIASSYTRDTRSLGNDKCLYNAPDGKHCAFALMVKDTKLLTPFEGNVCANIIGDLGADILKDEFKGYPVHFYTRIQQLHDIGYYWNEKGLSDDGRLYADKIINDY